MSTSAERKQERTAAYTSRPTEGGIFCMRNTVSGRVVVLTAMDPRGQQNRFLFSASTGSCTFLPLQEDWSRCGASAFTFEILETLKKRPEQTDRAYREDLEVLAEAWKERLTAEGALLYNKK